MKKLVFLLLISLLIIGTVSAQGWGWTPAETIRVEGTLQMQNGHIVLSTGTAVYFIPGLMRYIGFIEGLREGTRISAEGFVSGNFLQAIKLIIGGREYNLTANNQTPGGFMGGPMGRHHGRGRGCCWW